MTVVTMLPAHQVMCLELSDSQAEGSGNVSSASPRLAETSSSTIVWQILQIVQVRCSDADEARELRKWAASNWCGTATASGRRASGNG